MTKNKKPKPLPPLLLATIRRQQIIDEHRRVKASSAFQPIYKGDKRNDVIDKIKAILRRFRLSIWEWEASCRHGLRAALCMEGYAWAHADAEAASLVDSALKILGGGDRPTWIEGQKEYVIPYEICQNYGCGNELDDDDRLRHRRFCSDACRNAAIQHRADLAAYISHGVIQHAGYVIRKERLPRKQCENPDCGEWFQPAHAHTKACSAECGQAIMERAIKPRECANPACKTVWKPKVRTHKFCCHECSVEARALVLPMRRCQNPKCKSPEYRPRHETQMFCSDPCKQQARYWEAKTYHAPQTCERPSCTNRFTPKKKGARFCCEKCARRNAYEREKLKRKAA
jgi:hypothetical protein